MRTFNQIKHGAGIRRNKLKRLENKVRSRSVALRYLPGVSVIVPCYQCSATLEETLASLYDQTLEFEDYEVILVFNGEDDGSIEIAKSFVARYPEINIRFFFNSKASAGAARNIALNLVRHANVTFVDADDLVEHSFQKLLSTRCLLKLV